MSIARSHATDEPPVRAGGPMGSDTGASKGTRGTASLLPETWHASRFVNIEQLTRFLNSVKLKALNQ
jgi:hypothetical protein